jgi:RNA recognition motif-containing protein
MTTSACFTQYGQIIGVNVRVDRLTNKPKGFAFVTFDSVSSATLAVEEMNGYVYQGRALTVGRAEARGQNKSEDAGDAAWKTIPTASKKDKDSKLARKTEKSKSTWDHWTGPTTKK